MHDRSSETTTMKLLDAWKAKRGIASDYGAGVALGAKRQTISGWRNGKSHASAAYAARMAADLGLDELAVLAAIEADRSYNSDDRRIWQKHGRTAFVALLLGITVDMPQAHELTRLPALEPVQPLMTSQNPTVRATPRWPRRRRQ